MPLALELQLLQTETTVRSPSELSLPPCRLDDFFLCVLKLSRLLVPFICFSPSILLLEYAMHEFFFRALQIDSHYHYRVSQAQIYLACVGATLRFVLYCL